MSDLKRPKIECTIPSYEVFNSTSEKGKYLRFERDLYGSVVRIVICEEDGEVWKELAEMNVSLGMLDSLTKAIM